eukprot:TRINITY_DN39402_c0_g1_i1.p1 TRINITY_DN39402_c0_g1~~TRINITY_DN39402_c0_g1_i1.p1  ORF type:complete len:794 (-),score=110.97 TRINITY_DN39402_c0_g1_i1:183-2507(-)
MSCKERSHEISKLLQTINDLHVTEVGLLRKKVEELRCQLRTNFEHDVQPCFEASGSSTSVPPERPHLHLEAQEFDDRLFKTNDRVGEAKAQNESSDKCTIMSQSANTVSFANSELSSARSSVVGAPTSVGTSDAAGVATRPTFSPSMHITALHRAATGAKTDDCSDEQAMLGGGVNGRGSFIGLREPATRTSTTHNRFEQGRQSIASWLNVDPQASASFSARTSYNKPRVSRSTLPNAQQSILDLKALSRPKTSTRRTHIVPQKTGHKLSASDITRFVESEKFELASCILICVNTMFLALEVQYVGFDVAFAIQYGNNSADQMWPGVGSTLEISSWIFGVLFTIEVVLKLVGQTKRFFRVPWNWIDTAIVSLWMFTCLEASFSLGLNSQFLRLARLVRIVRMLKVFKSVHNVDALFLMTTAIQGSMHILMWTFVILSMFQVTTALFVSQYLHEFYFCGDCSVDALEQQQVFVYFGNFSRSFFSMYEITLANWPTCVRILGESVGEGFLYFGLLHKLVIGFAVVGIINGVFMQETLKVAAMDDNLMVRQKQRQLTSLKKKMELLMMEADSEEQDGQISFEEWCNTVDDPVIALWLRSLEVDPSDAAKLFLMIDTSRDGQITLDELIDGVEKLKGPARSLDIHWMIEQQAELLSVVQELGLKTHLPSHKSSNAYRVAGGADAPSSLGARLHVSQASNSQSAGADTSAASGGGPRHDGLVNETDHRFDSFASVDGFASFDYEEQKDMPASLDELDCGTSCRLEDSDTAMKVNNVSAI